MAKFRPVKLILSITVFSVIIVGILASTTNDGAIGFTLEIPTNSIITIVDAQGNEVDVEFSDEVQENVACWIRGEMEIINKFGDVIATEEGRILKLNPTLPLRLTDQETGINPFVESILTGDGGFFVKPTIQCSVNLDADINPQTVNFNPFLSQVRFDTSLLIHETDVVVRIYTSDKSCGLSGLFSGGCGNGLFHDSFNGELKIKEQVIRDSGKKVLGGLVVESERLEAYLEDGRYGSRFVVTIDGVIEISYLSQPSFKYQIPINTQREELVNHPATLWWGTNNWDNIFSDLQMVRDIEVEKNVSVGGNPDCPIGEHKDLATNDCVPDSPNPNNSCGVNEVWEMGTCVAVVTIPTNPDGTPICNPPQVPSGNLCVNPSGGTTTGGTGIDVIDELIACLNSGSSDCLFSENFIVIWLGLVGLIIIVIALIQGASRSRPVDIYGVPSGF